MDESHVVTAGERLLADAGEPHRLGLLAGVAEERRHDGQLLLLAARAAEERDARPLGAAVDPDPGWHRRCRFLLFTVHHRLLPDLSRLRPAHLRPLGKSPGRTAPSLTRNASSSS